MEDEMRLSQLIEFLQDMQEQVDDQDIDCDPEIVVHQQPNYPMAGRLENVRFAMADGKVQVWLASGDTYEYGSKSAWEEGDDLLAIMKGDASEEVE
jgi:hypothetical protein